ncbi:MAG TPA: NYN domain-containing protein [Vicinamibacteria bacterium]|nr:NYN domain-containing protein [Vicinamibacteria bacterium]
MASTTQDEQRLALFIDFENIAIGVRDAHYRKFDINLVLERLLDKGKLLSKKAYADWSRYSDYKRSFHEAAIELIEVPQKSVGGKNSADIRLVVDAMDMSFQKEHINCFVVASGDSDFSPLVSKLKENNKYVIGLGVKNSTSDLLIENCDEFIFYEDLVRGQQRPIPVIANVPEKVQECFALLVDSILALQRENKEILWGSMVKETMKRKKPSFNETYYGFRTFSHLLEDAQRRGIVTLRRDQRSGSYIVEDLGAAGVTALRGDVGPALQPMPAPAPLPPAAPLPQRPAEPSAPLAEAVVAAEAANGSRPSRRRRGRGRRPRSASVLAAGAFMDGSGSQGTADGHDAQDGDEGDDDLGAGDDLHEDSHHEDSHHEEEDAAHGASTEPTPAPDSPPAEPAGERSPFSFFSWIRREPAQAPAATDESPRDPAKGEPRE